MLESQSSVLRALAGLDRELAPTLPADVPHPAAAEARLAAGLPALLDEPLLDVATFCNALQAVARVLRTDPSHMTAAETAERMSHDADLADTLLAAALAGNWESIEPAVTRAGHDADAATVLADHAVRPWLRLAAARIQASLQSANWRAGYCPACGAPPLLAELRGAEHERVLRCGRCGSGWAFPRLACPGCGEQEHQKLGALHAENQLDFLRVDTCESCGTYVKAIAVLDPLPAAELLLADLKSTALDFAALERGYRRPLSRPV